jgi:uncharacterized protein YicC (UPF0701 family)
LTFLSGWRRRPKLEQTGARITDTIINRSNTVADSFRESAEALVAALNSRGDAVKDMLGARLRAFEDMFNQVALNSPEKISRDFSNLGNLITRHMTEFDHTVKKSWWRAGWTVAQRTQEVGGSAQLRRYIDQRVTGRTDAFPAR